MLLSLLTSPCLSHKHNDTPEHMLSYLCSGGQQKSTTSTVRGLDEDEEETDDRDTHKYTPTTTIPTVNATHNGTETKHTERNGEEEQGDDETYGLDDSEMPEDGTCERISEMVRERERVREKSE